MKIDRLVIHSGLSYHLGLEFILCGNGKDRVTFTVTSIIEHQAEFKGDKVYYDIFFSNNNIKRIFDVKEIDYQQE